MMRFDMRARHRRPGDRPLRGRARDGRAGPNSGAASRRSSASTTRRPTATCRPRWSWRRRWRRARPRCRSSSPSLMLPLYDPIRLAEDMVVLDIISSGRVSYVGGRRVPARGVRDVRRRLRPPRPDRRGATRAAAAGQDRRAVRARGPTHPRHPAAGHARRAEVVWGGGSVPRPGGPAATASASSPRAATRRCGGRLRRGGPGRTATSPGCACSRRATAHRCSSPTTSTGRGTSSARTSCTTSGATPPSTRATPTPPASRSARSVDELRAENRSHRIVTVDEAVAMSGPAAAPAPPPRRRAPTRYRLALPAHRHRRVRHPGPRLVS